MSLDADFRDEMKSLEVLHSMCSIHDCCYDFTKLIREYFE